jgi:hypothetical protein
MLSYLLSFLFPASCSVSPRFSSSPFIVSRPGFPFPLPLSSFLFRAFPVLVSSLCFPCFSSLVRWFRFLFPLPPLSFSDSSSRFLFPLPGSPSRFPPPRCSLFPVVPHPSVLFPVTSSPCFIFVFLEIRPSKDEEVMVIDGEIPERGFTCFFLIYYSLEADVVRASAIERSDGGKQGNSGDVDPFRAVFRLLNSWSSWAISV